LFTHHAFEGKVVLMVSS